GHRRGARAGQRALSLFRRRRRPRASLLDHTRRAQPGGRAVPAISRATSNVIGACARQRPDAMKARDRSSMSQHWEHAPPAPRPDPSLDTELAPEPLPAIYGALKRVLPPLLRRFFSFRVTGLEHLPGQGPYIVAANHANYLDGVVLASALPRKISFLVMPRV